jgi:hypothetical protein
MDEYQKINILLSEYNSLQNWLNLRVNNIYQVIGIGPTALAITLFRDRSNIPRVGRLPWRMVLLSRKAPNRRERSTPEECVQSLRQALK